ncbi:uncharacterized protein B0J16DRAFT_56841 [Fusarium flagelliforme]|uniref:uncharacterized protein n=1 Tax=Fusarium flagelliforme TaxID=2675880 RepID=UPI001E8E4953|nr:uncharacterized protein B0J16DRAFT_56841 [Fusarium flagelliforme]KAH7192267.1 hypothetical protein B0J16DRAFT_56841 [Fusarium flagelliforme]
MQTDLIVAFLCFASLLTYKIARVVIVQLIVSHNIRYNRRSNCLNSSECHSERDTEDSTAAVPLTLDPTSRSENGDQPDTWCSLFYCIIVYQTPLELYWRLFYP